MKKKMTNTDRRIIFAKIGIVASIIFTLYKAAKGEHTTIGLCLLAVCSASLAAARNNPKNNK